MFARWHLCASSSRSPSLVSQCGSVSTLNCAYVIGSVAYVAVVVVRVTGSATTYLVTVHDGSPSDLPDGHVLAECGTFSIVVRDSECTSISALAASGGSGT